MPANVVKSNIKCKLNRLQLEKVYSDLNLQGLNAQV